MSVYDRLKTLNITLPEVAPPVASFQPFVGAGNLLFVSGHIAKKDGHPWSGKAGSDISLEQAKEAARSVAIDLLGTLHSATGSLDRVRQIVKLTVLVNSSPSFTDHHLVANGASDLLAMVFGHSGLHCRSAFGVMQIPFGSVVEIEMIAEIE